MPEPGMKQATSACSCCDANIPVSCSLVACRPSSMCRRILTRYARLGCRAAAAHSVCMYSVPQPTALSCRVYALAYEYSRLPVPCHVVP